MGGSGTARRAVGGCANPYTYGYDPHGSLSLLLDDRKAAYSYTAYGEGDEDLTYEHILAAATMEEFGATPTFEQTTGSRCVRSRSSGLSSSGQMSVRSGWPSRDARLSFALVAARDPAFRFVERRIQPRDSNLENDESYSLLEPTQHLDPDRSDVEIRSEVGLGRFGKRRSGDRGVGVAAG
jgi:hypothetical protein